MCACAYVFVWRFLKRKENNFLKKYKELRNKTKEQLNYLCFIVAVWLSNQFGLIKSRKLIIKDNWEEIIRIFQTNTSLS